MKRKLNWLFLAAVIAATGTAHAESGSMFERAKNYLKETFNKTKQAFSSDDTPSPKLPPPVMPKPVVTTPPAPAAQNSNNGQVDYDEISYHYGEIDENVIAQPAKMYSKYYYTSIGMGCIQKISATDKRVWVLDTEALEYYDKKEATWGVLKFHTASKDKAELGPYLPEQSGEDRIKTIAGAGQYLWILTDSSILRLDETTLSVERISNKKFKPGIKQLSATKNGLWMSYYKDLYLSEIDGNSLKIRHYDISKSSPTLTSPDNMMADGDFIWMTHHIASNAQSEAQSDGHRTWNPQRNVFSRMNTKTGETEIFTPASLEELAQAQRERYSDGDEEERPRGPQFHMFDIAVDSSTVYFSGAGMIISLDKKTATWNTNPSDNLLLLTSYNGFLWAGTSYDMNSASSFVLKYLKDPAQKWSYGAFAEETLLVALYADNDAIWFATPTKITRLRPETKELSIFSLNHEGNEVEQAEGIIYKDWITNDIQPQVTVEYEDDYISLSYQGEALSRPENMSINWTNLVYADDGKNFWISGTFELGSKLFRYSYSESKWSDEPYNEQGLLALPVSMAFTGGTLWAETHGALYSHHDKRWTKEIDGNHFKLIHCDGKVYAICDAGFFVHEKQWKKLADIAIPNLESATLAHTAGNDIILFSHGKIFLYKAKKDRWLSTEKEDPGITAIGEDKHGNLWAKGDTLSRIKENGSRLQTEPVPVPMKVYRRVYRQEKWNRLTNPDEQE